MHERYRSIPRILAVLFASHLITVSFFTFDAFADAPVIDHSIGTVPTIFGGGAGTSSSSPVGSLPEDVPPLPTSIQQNPVGPTMDQNCSGRGASNRLHYYCIFVNFDSLRPEEGYVWNEHPKGYDKEGDFRRSDLIDGVWDIPNAWTQVAGFGDYINAEGKLCGCFRSVHGCFAPDVQITMADQSLKPVEELQAGDFTWNPITRHPARVKKIYEGPEAKPLVELGYGTETVQVSSEHPVLVAQTDSPAQLTTVSLNQRSESAPDRYAYRKASELKLGDRIRDKDGNFQTLTIYRRLPLAPGQMVINFELEGDPSDMQQHMVISNGIVTGDLNAQWVLGGAVSH